MIYAVSIRCEEAKQALLSEDTIYTVEFISDRPVTRDTIPVRTLVPIKDMPVPAFGVEYIFAQTVTLHANRSVIPYRSLEESLGDSTVAAIVGPADVRITVTGPLVKNKVEALAKGYYGKGVKYEKTDR